MAGVTYTAPLSTSLLVGWSCAKSPLLKFAFHRSHSAVLGREELQGVELFNEGNHIGCGRLRIHPKRLGQVLRDVGDGGGAIAPLPDITSGRVQLMNQPTATIEHDRFPLHKTHTHVRPLFRVMGCHFD